jgi:hypothetical protein
VIKVLMSSNKRSPSKKAPDNDAGILGPASPNKRVSFSGKESIPPFGGKMVASLRGLTKVYGIFIADRKS